MLRSWINRLQDSFIPSQKIGIALGRSHVWAAQSSIGDNSRTVDWIKSQQSGPRLFEGEPDPQTMANLKSVISKLLTSSDQPFLQIRVSLPDPVVRMSVLEWDEVPKAITEQRRLVAWQLGKQYEIKTEGLTASHQLLGKENDHFLVLGMIMDSAWIEAIQGVFSEAGLLIHRLEPEIVAGFDSIYPDLPDEEGAALVNVGIETWTLCAWDEQKRLRMVRSDWLDRPISGMNQEQLNRKVHDTQHAIVAFTHGNAGRSIKKIYVRGRAQDVSIVADALDQRTHEQAIRVNVDEALGKNISPVNDEAISSSTLAMVLA